MENTGFIAMSRQGALRRNMDVIANNIANMNTTAYKAEEMMFIDHVIKSKGGHSVFGDKLSYVRDIATRIDLSEGPLKSTGNPLDIAVRGNSFLAVQTVEGERYTRNGRLELDSGGQLVNEAGQPILSDGGTPVFFAPEDTDITFSKDGTISTNNGVVGRLRVVSFENPQNLSRLPGGLYESETPPIDAVERDVVQGMLEGSNINGVVEMTNMIDVHRSYDRIRKITDDEDKRIKKMMEAYRVSA